jgi:hypothetical protein
MRRLFVALALMLVLAGSVVGGGVSGVEASGGATAVEVVLEAAPAPAEGEVLQSNHTGWETVYFCEGGRLYRLTQYVVHHGSGINSYHTVSSQSWPVYVGRCYGWW